ncbi:SIR2 family protein, partial [Salmonella enterica]|nr:SIR2 family protein [Salmonella enterica]
AGYLNLSVFGPTTAIINGTLGKWTFEQFELKNKETCDSFWNAKDKKLLLGDFNYLVDFLVGNSGRSSEIEVSINED